MRHSIPFDNADTYYCRKGEAEASREMLSIDQRQKKMEGGSPILMFVASLSKGLLLLPHTGPTSAL